MFLGLAEGQSLGLGEEVGKQDTVMEGVADRVKGSGRGDEVGRDQLGPLVNELVERVLSVGSGSTPNDRLKYRNDQ